MATDIHDFGPPPGDDMEDPDAPVGVRGDYTATRERDRYEQSARGKQKANGRFDDSQVGRTYTERYQQAPTFFNNDIDRPASQSPERIAELQRQLVQAGLLSPRGFSLGVWDSPTRNAYKEVLAHANRAGLTSAEESLAVFLRSPQPSTGAERAPFRVELPNPDDVRAMIDALVPNVLGRGLDAAETEALIGTYNSLLTNAQRADYDTELTGGTITDAPDIKTFITNEATRRHPTDAHVTSLANLSKQVLEGLQGQGATQADRVF